MEKRGKLSYLFMCLMFVLLVYPFIEKTPMAGKMLALFFSFILVSGVYAVTARNRIKMYVSLLLAVPALALLWFDQFFAGKALDILTVSSLVFFSFFTLSCIVRYLMAEKKVTGDVLAGAASAYLLIGISFGMLCGLLEMVAPGSFTISKVMGAGALSKWATFNYYSFTTLTTLGYGDITPISTRAQSFATVEAATGVLFTALLISRLVGMYLYQLREGGKGQDRPGSL